MMDFLETPLGKRAAVFIAARLVRASFATKTSNLTTDSTDLHGSKKFQRTGEADFATLCLRPSARTPPPISVLLKTKVKPQFDSPVDRAVEALFPVFQGFNLAQFQPCFFVFTVRSAEGRNALKSCSVQDSLICYLPPA
jgi:hypothetical protein